MRTYRVALIGFGGVNRALAQLLMTEPERFAAQGVELRVTAITDLRQGSLVQEGGIDLATVLSLPASASFGSLPGGSAATDNRQVIQHGPVDIVAEATFTNPIDGEPATSHVRWALEAGRHVVTTNKGPVAHHARELATVAAQHAVRFEYEGAVMSGTPVLRFARTLFSGLQVQGVQGILNGTCNFVLDRMLTGLSLTDAVAEAQELGYAEADPTADISGSDTRLKTAILANELLGAELLPDQIPTEGIERLTPEMVRSAQQEGRRWRLIGTSRRGEHGIEVHVRPVALPANHPLAGISGATNAVCFTTDLLGDVTVSGPGAGRVETAYALISDILAIDATRLRTSPTPGGVATARPEREDDHA